MNGMEVENATFEESTVDEDMTAPEHPIHECPSEETSLYGDFDGAIDLMKGYIARVKSLGESHRLAADATNLAAAYSDLGILEGCGINEKISAVSRKHLVMMILERCTLLTISPPVCM